jgi:hypothetical protein
MKFVTLYFNIVYKLVVIHVVIKSTDMVWTILNLNELKFNHLSSSLFTHSPFPFDGPIPHMPPPPPPRSTYFHRKTYILGHILCLIQPEDGNYNVHQNVGRASPFDVTTSLKPEATQAGVYVSSLNTVHNFLLP